MTFQEVVLYDQLEVVFVVLQLDPVGADRLFDLPDLLVVLIQILLHRLSFKQVLLRALVEDLHLDSVLVDLLVKGCVLFFQLLQLVP